MKPAKTIDVCVSRLSPDGAGIADVDDAEVHIVGLLPGERATVEVEHRSPHRAQAWARIVKQLGPTSEARVRPACPSFGECGGCRWQHTNVATQHLEKRRRILDAFAQVGLATVAVDSVVASPRSSEYRTVSKYVIGSSGSGVTLGAYAPRTHRLVSTLGCRQVVSNIDHVATALRDVLANSEFAVYDEATRGGILRYALVRCGVDGQCVVGLIARSKVAEAKRQALIEAIVNSSPLVKGAHWFENDRTDGGLLGAIEPVSGQGSMTVREAIGELDIEVPLTAFWQVNREQAAAIYQHIAEVVESLPLGDMPVLDAYAGVGPIGLWIASRGTAVVSVESNSVAVAQAATLASANRLNVEAVCADTATFLEGDRRFGVVVVNPPRKGLAAAVRGKLLSVTDSLVYLSCGPESLARDLAVLSAQFEITAVEPFDMMPGTGQIETLVTLNRR